MRADLDIVAEFDPADGHGGEVMVDEHVLSESDLLWEIDLRGREHTQSFRNISVKQFAQGLRPFLRLRLRMIQMKQSPVRPVQFCNCRAVFFGHHVNGISVFQLLKNIHFSSNAGLQPANCTSCSSVR